MSFLAPAAFLFAAAIPVVVVFYLLKRKRVVRLVSSTLLWQRFLSDNQANAPFQKLRHNWLLVLQILLLLFAVLALSRPFFAGNTSNSSFRVVILDASASMKSTDEVPSRFEKARAEALKLVDAMKEDTEMLVLQAGGRTEVKQSATSNKAALRRAIRSCEATDSSTRLTEALKLADTMVRNRRDPEVHLFSDGAAAGLSEFENKGMTVVFHGVGKNANNVGITTLDIRENPENRAQRAIYTSVANFSSNSVQTTLELLFDNQLITARPITVAAGDTSPQVFIASQEKDGIFTVRIDTKDDLASDNQASIVSILPLPAKVLLVTPGNRFLEKAIKASANVNLTVVKECATTAEDYDLVVLDNIIPSVWPKPNVLAFHVVNTNWFEGWSKVEAPVIVDWKNIHPLLRYINLDNVAIGETLGVKTPSWGISLVDAQQTPLVIAGELNHERIVWVGFDSLQSTWPLRISFPMFVANAVEWLNPATLKSSQLMLHAGDTFRLGMAQAVNDLEAVYPDGSRKNLNLKGARELVFSDTARQGAYHLIAGTNKLDFCVNVLDAAESSTSPKKELQMGKFNTISASNVKRANVEIWRWLAAVALSVLLFEWWYYHKRTV
jgi:hypothetical protein